jgi:sugar-specific transcriptional regulator TrmB
LTILTTIVVNIVMKTVIFKLVQLGFSEYEAKAYVALLGENPLTAYEIAKNSGIPTSKIYEVIRKLENRRTIQSIHGERSKMFIPLSPDEFIKSFRSTIEDNLQAIKNELGKKDVRYCVYVCSIVNMAYRNKTTLRTAS